MIVTQKFDPVLDVNSTIEERLKYLNIGPDTDLILASLVNRTEENLKQNVTSARRRYSNLHPNNNSRDAGQRGFRDRRSSSLKKQPSYGRRNHSTANETVEYNPKWSPKRKENKTRTTSQNDNKKWEVPETKSCRDYPNRREYSGLEFLLTQVWKIRPSANSTLILVNLGYWNAVVGTQNLVLPTNIEKHNDFRGQPLIVGIKNVTQSASESGGGTVKDLSPQSSDDEMDDGSHLMDLLDFIARSLNAT